MKKNPNSFGFFFVQLGTGTKRTFKIKSELVINLRIHRHNEIPFY